MRLFKYILLGLICQFAIYQYSTAQVSALATDYATRLNEAYKSNEKLRSSYNPTTYETNTFANIILGKGETIPAWAGELNKSLALREPFGITRVNFYIVSISSKDALKIIGSEELFCNQVFTSSNISKEKGIIIFCFPSCGYKDPYKGYTCNYKYLVRFGKTLAGNSELFKGEIARVASEYSSNGTALTKLLIDNDFLRKLITTEELENLATTCANNFTTQLLAKRYQFIVADFYTEIKDKDILNFGSVKSSELIKFRQFVFKENDVKKINEKLTFLSLFGNKQIYYLIGQKPDEIDKFNANQFTELVAKKIRFSLNHYASSDEILRNSVIELFLYDVANSDLVHGSYQQGNIVFDNTVNAKLPIGLDKSNKESLIKYCENTLQNVRDKSLTDYSKILTNIITYNKMFSLQEYQKKIRLISRDWYTNYAAFTSTDYIIKIMELTTFDTVNYYHILIENGSASTSDISKLAGPEYNDLIVTSTYSKAGQKSFVSSVKFGDVRLTKYEKTYNDLLNNPELITMSDKGSIPFYYADAEMSAKILNGYRSGLVTAIRGINRIETEEENRQEYWDKDVREYADFVLSSINTATISSDGKSLQNYIFTDNPIQINAYLKNISNEKFSVWDELKGKKLFVVSKYMDLHIQNEEMMQQFAKEVFEKLNYSKKDKIVLVLMPYFSVIDNMAPAKTYIWMGYSKGSSIQEGSPIAAVNKYCPNQIEIDLTYALQVFQNMVKPYYAYSYFINGTGDWYYKELRPASGEISGSTFIYDIRLFYEKGIKGGKYKKYYDYFEKTAYDAENNKKLIGEGLDPIKEAYLKMLTYMYQEGELTQIQFDGSGNPTVNISSGKELDISQYEEYMDFKITVPAMGDMFFFKYSVKERAIKEFHRTLIRASISSNAEELFGINHTVTRIVSYTIGKYIKKEDYSYAVKSDLFFDELKVFDAIYAACDIASLALSPFGLDFIPDGIQLLFACIENNPMQMAFSAASLVVPELAEQALKKIGNGVGYLVSLSKAGANTSDLVTDNLKIILNANGTTSILTKNAVEIATAGGKNADILLAAIDNPRMLESVNAVANFPGLQKQANIQILDNISPRFSFKGSSGTLEQGVALGKAFEGRSVADAAALFDNIKSADNLLGSVDELSYMGSKTSSQIDIVTKNGGETIGAIKNGKLEATRFLDDGTPIKSIDGQQLVKNADGDIGFLRLIDGDELTTFISKSLAEKSNQISTIWKTRYPVEEMLEGRCFFEDIMGQYRYGKASGWGHTADIASNFKGVDFYKEYTIVDGDIYAKTAVSMKTTITTDVNAWLASDPIKKNLSFLKDGLENGISSNGKKIFYESAEIHIYMPEGNITPARTKEWLNILTKNNPTIKFDIKALEDFIY